MLVGFSFNEAVFWVGAWEDELIHSDRGPNARNVGIDLMVDNFF